MDAADMTLSNYSPARVLPSRASNQHASTRTVLAGGGSGQSRLGHAGNVSLVSCRNRLLAGCVRPFYLTHAITHKPRPNSPTRGRPMAQSGSSTIAVVPSMARFTTRNANSPLDAMAARTGSDLRKCAGPDCAIFAACSLLNGPHQAMYKRKPDPRRITLGPLYFEARYLFLMWLSLAVDGTVVDPSVVRLSNTVPRQGYRT